MQQTFHEHWMRMALKLARNAADQGEVPIGAVLVKDGEMLASAYNMRETWQDPTAHAELLVIQQASRRLGGWRLTDCDLYVTLEPCPMCVGAAVLGRVRHIYYGAADPKGGALESKVSLLAPRLWNHIPEVTAGILAEECGMILKDFFRHLREKPIS